MSSLPNFWLKMIRTITCAPFCRIAFILSHGQSFTERGFSINQEVIDHNMLEKSFICQRLVYDVIHNGGSKLSDFQITPALRKNCLLSSEKYKLELEKY